ncbi:MAG: hydroxymethylbilane synthase [Candidatus Eremiobacteraeota bacterium]|nr:hydroxymethylbilane synthase [Candidatus Eremiobacteraeota bacterium]
MAASALHETPLTLRIATRKSALALAQTELVIAGLHQRPIAFEIVPITTKGDADQDRSLAVIGGDGVFVKELMTALLDGRADIAVHSLKDLPTEIPAALDAGVVLRREDARDVLISPDNRYASVEMMPQGATVGTSSLRREAQLRIRRPDLVIAPLRGNVDSRVRKVLNGDYDAALLALAGMKRLGLLATVGGGAALDYDTMVPAAGQGALYVQCRADDTATQALLSPLQDFSTARAVAMERSFLKRCGGGCVVPLGVHVEVDRAGWSLDACIASTDGTRFVRKHTRGSASDAAEAISQVEAVADEMLAAGGRQIIDGGSR